jgi:hypothetical protein
VILLRNRNTIKVIPVTPPEHAKKMPAAIELEEALDPDINDATGGKTPERPCPVMIACV